MRIQRKMKRVFLWPPQFNYAAWLRSYKEIKNLGEYLNLEREMGFRLSLKEKKDITKKLEMMAEIVSANLHVSGLPLPEPLWRTPKNERLNNEEE